MRKIKMLFALTACFFALGLTTSKAQSTGELNSVFFDVSTQSVLNYDKTFPSNISDFSFPYSMQASGGRVTFELDRNTFVYKILGGSKWSTIASWKDDYVGISFRLTSGESGIVKIRFSKQAVLDYINRK